MCIRDRDEADFAETLNELESWVGESSTESTEGFASAEPAAESAKPIAVSDGEIERLKKHAERNERTAEQRGSSRRRGSQKWDTGPGDNGLGKYASLGVVTVALAALVYFGLQRIRRAAPERTSTLAHAALNENIVSKGRPRSLLGSNAAAISNSQNDSDIFNKSEVEPLIDTAGEPPLVSPPPLAPPVVNPSVFGSKPDRESNKPATRRTLVPEATSESTSTAQVANREPLDTNSFEQPIATAVNQEPSEAETPSNDNGSSGGPVETPVAEDAQTNDAPKAAVNNTETVSYTHLTLPTIYSV